jgi:pantoate--beta-alanine ligase
MEIIRVPRIMQDTSRGHIIHGRTIGFVPTMGALHEGHLSLVKRSKSENDITVVSIFVNPIQFAPSEDFYKYPRDIEGDTEKLKGEGVDVLFIPEISLMYPERFLTYVEVEKISEKLCGAFRQGHFRGVATIVIKLLNIVKPTRAYFGQKDYQQRKASIVIYRCLSEASELIKSGIMDALYIKGIMRNRLLKEPAVSEIDYCGVYDTVSLDEVLEIKSDVLLAVAARLGDTRLIDNIVVNAIKDR